ncbi:MAG: hypothetical protein RL088_1492 [Verrucomicrobiota bacterium]|jgi:hypothetical protein
MSSLFRTFLAVATLTILSACGLTKGKEIATKSVETFRQQFSESKFAEIYSAATPAFKASVNEANFTKFIQAVQRKLGAYKSSTQRGWKVNSINGTTSVVLNYDSVFEQGSAVETFTFIISGDSAVLQGYNVNSPALIIN